MTKQLSWLQRQLENIWKKIIKKFFNFFKYGHCFIISIFLFKFDRIIFCLFMQIDITLYQKYLSKYFPITERKPNELQIKAENLKIEPDITAVILKAKDELKLRREASIIEDKIPTDDVKNDIVDIVDKSTDKPILVIEDVAGVSYPQETVLIQETNTSNKTKQEPELNDYSSVIKTEVLETKDQPQTEKDNYLVSLTIEDKADNSNIESMIESKVLETKPEPISRNDALIIEDKTMNVDKPTDQATVVIEDVYEASNPEEIVLIVDSNTSESKEQEPVLEDDTSIGTEPETKEEIVDENSKYLKEVPSKVTSNEDTSNDIDEKFKDQQVVEEEPVILISEEKPSENSEEVLVIQDESDVKSEPQMISQTLSDSEKHAPNSAETISKEITSEDDEFKKIQDLSTSSNAKEEA